MKKAHLGIISVLVLLISACTVGCTVSSATDLMEGISSGDVIGRPADDTFIENMADFSVELSKNSFTEKENSLISPISVIYALAMTANGADNKTLEQMEQVLGGDIPLTELNGYLYSYAKSLPSDKKAKFGMANSIWLRDEERLQVDPDFLQTNADYYNAAIFKSAFDANTLKDINRWVKSNTDGMIDKILDEIDPDTVAYLINATVFDAEWKEIYTKDSINEDVFTDINGEEQDIDFMYSEEYQYLSDDKATGFVKPYAGGQYSFAALLPNEDVRIEDYIKTLSGSHFIEMINNAENIDVMTSIPKFSYDYEITMNSALKRLGMPDAFDSVKADFSKMATSERGNIFIYEVLHKTFITVDERGTKAGAATVVEMAGGGAPGEPKSVYLDRPFIYAIVDNETGLPLFLGTVVTV